MRSLVLLAVLLVVGGIYLFGGRKLDKEQLLDFYRVQEAAQLTLDDQRMCDLLADDFEQHTRVRGGRLDIPARMDKGDYCIALAQQFSVQRQLTGQLRAMVTQQLWLDGVTLADDRRSAVMHMRAVQALPGMRLSARYDVHVERLRWRMQVTRSEAVVSVGGG